MKQYFFILLISIALISPIYSVETLNELADLIDINLASAENNLNSVGPLDATVNQLQSVYDTVKQVSSSSNANIFETRANLDLLKANLNSEKNLSKELNVLNSRKNYEIQQARKETAKINELEAKLSESEKIKFKILIDAQMEMRKEDSNLRNLDFSEDIKYTISKGKEIQGFMGLCFGAFFKNVPPSFCWKKGGDFGLIPNSCPSDHFRYLAMCYKECESGYHFNLGICWETCKPDYEDIGLICGRSVIKWYFKKSYIPSFLTNFDSQVTCPPDTYKGGALCYRDCAKNLMVNCGIGACAQSKGACAQGVIQIALEFLTGLGEFILFLVSLGSSSAATPAISTAQKTLVEGVKLAGKTALNAAFDSFKKWIASFTKEKIVEWLKKKVVPFIIEKGSKVLIEKACGTVGDYIFNETLEKNEPNLEINPRPEGFKFNETIPIYGICSKVSLSNGNPNDEIACARSILQNVGMIDPTGIAAMAAAFMQPVCDV